MAPLHVATLTVQRELPKYEVIFASMVSTLPYLCTKNKTMAPLHVATLTVYEMGGVTPTHHTLLPV